MHDPRARELILPPGSSAGTIAHEIAHDLDWQVALRRYRVRGDYATTARRAQQRPPRHRGCAVSPGRRGRCDRHVRERHARARAPAGRELRPGHRLVRRGVARGQGRTNGYLSSVQDEVLTGYGTVRPPDITGRAGDALINILDEVAPLYPETRDWFLRSYGTGRALNSFDLMRSIARSSCRCRRRNRPRWRPKARRPCSRRIAPSGRAQPRLSPPSTSGSAARPGARTTARAGTRRRAWSSRRRPPGRAASRSSRPSAWRRVRRALGGAPPLWRAVAAAGDGRGHAGTAHAAGRRGTRRRPLRRQGRGDRLRAALVAYRTAPHSPSHSPADLPRGPDASARQTPVTPAPQMIL
jgi:hypothetical protein